MNGQCATFTTDSRNFYLPELTVAADGASPTTLTYSGYSCESSTQNSQAVAWTTGSTAPGNYRWVTIGRVWM
ncbi:hypothetical protein [Streptomyces sp. NPDC096132]|uniref:hypothetical protein n=1 Tax=Streptomyces sp. NPDC096132 TaxID=3366075 RepID=UPI00382D6140